MPDFVKERSVKYLSRDFQSFKRDLINFSKAHHSGVFQDFNETSPGMALLELQAYIGDVLSFYQDRQFNELKEDSARQIENVTSIAKMRGYRPAGKRAARGTEAFFVEVPSDTDGGAVIPDDTFAPILPKGSRIQGPNGVFFETLDNVDFSDHDERAVTGSQFDGSGVPTHFAVRKDVEITAGETKTDSFTVSNFEAFKSLELSREDVIEVLSVVDSDGNEWTEVDFLAQETVYSAIVNTGNDNDAVPFVLKLISVPRRFITDRNPTTNKTSLIFGSGDGVNFDDELVPNLADLAIPLPGRRTFTTVAIDPQNFLKTRTLGLSPFNTTLTVTYRIGGGDNTNVPGGTIRTVTDAELEFSSTSLDPQKKSAVVASLECINPSKTEGGGPGESIAEIKANSAAFFAAQERVVSKEDFIARSMSIPEKFGKPEKVFVRRNNLNNLALDLHVLAKDENGHLTLATATLKNNLKTYLTPFRMLTDGVNILDGTIVDLRCNFGIVTSPKVNRTEVLAKCLDVVRTYLDTSKMQIGQPIVLSDLSAEIQSVLGVISVYELKFTNVIGTTDGLSYSASRFDVSANVRNNILYCPENAIFEIKYPTKDIVGVSK